jgi:hypothetical protein
VPRPRPAPDTVVGRDGKAYPGRRQRPRITLPLPAGPTAAVIEDLIRRLAELQLRVGVAQLDPAVTPTQAARLLAELDRHSGGLRRVCKLLEARATVDGDT